MTEHLSREALGRYFAGTSLGSEKEKVEKHLFYCSVCMEQFTINELAEIAEEAKARLVVAIRAGERN